MTVTSGGIGNKSVGRGTTVVTWVFFLGGRNLVLEL
jgi:hypothetical protein